MQATPPVEAGEKAALVLAKIQIADNQLDDATTTLDALNAYQNTWLAIHQLSAASASNLTP